MCVRERVRESVRRNGGTGYEGEIAGGNSKVARQ